VELAMNEREGGLEARREVSLLRDQCQQLGVAVSSLAGAKAVDVASYVQQVL
ncbi:hypothetical protein KIPB_014487, partial [Kipferlia bialata]